MIEPTANAVLFNIQRTGQDSFAAAAAEKK
jgi:hypothetical protein